QDAVSGHAGGVAGRADGAVAGRGGRQDRLAAAGGGGRDLAAALQLRALVARQGQLAAGAALAGDLRRAGPDGRGAADCRKSPVRLTQPAWACVAKRRCLVAIGPDLCIGRLEKGVNGGRGETGTGRSTYGTGLAHAGACAIRERGGRPMPSATRVRNAKE